jgi:parallel beta-helix repeat protein
MHYITIANLQIDGVKATYTNSNYNHGISSRDLQQSKIYNVWVINCAATGIRLSTNLYDNIIQGNHLTANRYGIELTGNSSAGNVVTDNVIQDNTAYGISLSAHRTTVTGNDVSSNGTNGIYNYGYDDNVITGNHIYGNTGHGIALEEDADRNTISGNTISANLLSGIRITGSNNNLVSGNNVYNNGASTSWDAIGISGDSDNNNISSNHITDTAGTSHAIDIVDATVNNTYLAGNTYSGTGAATINDAGTGTIYGSQLANSGTDLLLTPSGNVGIGTTDPEALLQLGTPTSSLGTLRLAGDTSGYIQIQPSTAAGDWTLTLPTNDGDNGQVLTTDGNGVTSWATPAASGANTSLSNLDSVAINTSLISDAADTDDLGSATYEWNSLCLSDGSGLTA